MRADHECRLDPLPDPEGRPALTSDHAVEQALVERHVHVRRVRRRWNHVPLHLPHPVLGHRSATVVPMHRRTLWTLYAGNLLTAIGLWFFLPLLPIFIGRRGGSAALVGARCAR